jgi:hypothetical protein
VPPFFRFFIVLALGANALAAETITRPASVLTPPIRRAQKWNPLWSFGNASDPSPPAWYRPDDARRRWLWHLRNPLHNFTHYVIGVSDKPVTRTGRYPAHVFAPDGGWNWAFTRYRWLPLPFISYEGKHSRFYLGWRESGNFGGKLNFKQRSKPATNVTAGSGKST